MAQAESSLLGIALQVDKDTVNVTNLDFDYVLFRRGQLGVDNIFLPLGAEVGGGALERSVIKAGAAARGNLEVTPRPNSLGWFLYGMTGSVASVSEATPTTWAATTAYALDAYVIPTVPNGFIYKATVAGTSGASEPTWPTVAGQTVVDGTVTWICQNRGYSHVFKLPVDQFAAPYFTFRSAPGALFGEVFGGGRVFNASLNFQAPGFVNATYGLLANIIGSTVADPLTTWDPLLQVDGGPQLITPTSAIEIPTGGTASVLAGSFTMMSEIPLDQQYVVGNYFPEGLDIVHRVFSLNMQLKIADDSLYKKIAYDPAGGAAWTASILRESNIKLEFISDVEYDTAKPHKLIVAANGVTGANANVLWSSELIDIIARKVLVFNVTGTFIGDPLGGDPLVLTLKNTQVSYT